VAKENVLILTREISGKKNAMNLRLNEIMRFFSKRYNVYVVYPAKEDRRYMNLGISYIAIKSFLNMRLVRRVAYRHRLLGQIKGILDEINPKIIYTQEPTNTAVFRMAQDSIKIFDILGINQSESLKGEGGIIKYIKSIYNMNIERMGARQADFIFTVNNAHKREISKFTDKKIYVLRDGIDKHFFSPHKQLKKNRIECAFVGSLIKRRIENIMRAVPEALKHNSRLHFKIIGFGPDEKFYREMANNNNTSQFIEFTGYMENKKVYDALTTSDICFSDDWSYIGFPTKVFEYMAMGKAVLVEDTPAVREIVREDINGLLYKNAKDFVKKLLLLASDDTLRARIGRQARVDARNHTWDAREVEFNKILGDINGKTKR
jgi:glycosyltransferase involved in cell wall biosynthesis